MIHLNPDKKIAGVLAPVFALRGPDDLGVGDIAALKDLADWSRAAGFKLVQILPINETGGDNSPYNAISSVALDITTLDMKAVPDLTTAAYNLIAREYDLIGMCEGAVDYYEVKRLKHDMLKKAFERFQKREQKIESPRALEFKEFCERQKEWLENYTLFRTLMERNGSERWNSWPTEHQSPETTQSWIESLRPRARKLFLTRMQYFKYVQWIAFSQWKNLHDYCEECGIALMGDVPFGVSYYSNDVWADRDSFVLDWSGGAPPEPYFKEDEFTQKWGQNWGIPLYNWDVMRANNHRWWRQRVRKVREILDLFRIDHVLGCYRIFAFPWRPVQNQDFLNLTLEEAAARTSGRLPCFLLHDDSTDQNKEWNRLHGDALLRVLLEETGQFRLIAEDLGTVPDYVRPNLQSLQIAGFKIPQWEHQWHGELIEGSRYERLSIATYATHDHQPIRSLWENWHADIIADNEAAEYSRTEMHRMMRYCGLDTNNGWPEYSEKIREAMLATLYRSNSWQAICMVTDLFGMTTRFNVPGAVSASNWSNRMDLSVSAWSEDEDRKEKMAKITALLEETGRM